MTFNPLILGSIQESGAGGVLAYTASGNETPQTHGVYTSVTFQGSGSFQVTDNSAGAALDVLIVGGGASGSRYGSPTAGGGAGGFRTVNLVPTVQTYTITIGAGGADGHASNTTGVPNQGGDTSGFGYTSAGGGRGGHSATGYLAVAGGSGGGGGYNKNGASGNTPSTSPSQGNSGGNGGSTGGTTSLYTCGGGGGAGGSGSKGWGTFNGSWYSPAGGGNGGSGSANDYRTGSNVTYAGGGGGAGDCGGGLVRVPAS